jgi:microcystin-dependent protein
MGLESTTFITGLTSSWPLANDPKKQGDDHIRLIKAVLQATFPTASRAFYFPKTEVTGIALALDATDQNNTIILDTSGGQYNVTLPTLGVGDAGWECEVVKVTQDANAALVVPTSGTIRTRVGLVNSVRVGIANEPARFKWHGTGWDCFKYGPAIGSTESFDGATTPPGYLDNDGSVYNSTNFAELFAVLGTTTLRDKRGRAEIGSGTGAGLTNRVAGTNYGTETKMLAAAEIPSLTSVNAAQSITLNTPSGQKIAALDASNSWNASIDQTSGVGAFFARIANSGNINTITGFTGNNSITVAYTNGAQTALALLQPSIGVKKIIRAC